MRPTLGDLEVKKESQEDNNMLIADFTREEVRKAVWDSNGEKSLGHDGFNFIFIQECWGFLEEDILKFVLEFHLSATLPKAITTAFIALVPKNFNPQGLGEYHPICLMLVQDSF